MLELHAVRDLGQRIVACEIADAPLGALALGDVASDEDHALELRVGARDLRTGQRDGDGLTLARAHQCLARILRSLQQIERAALRLVDDEHHALADEFFFGIAKQALSGEIDDAYHAIRRRDEHGVRHAAEHAVQVIASDGGAAQPQAHALEGRLQIADLVVADDVEWAGVVALAHALGAAREGGQRFCEAPTGPPGEPTTDRETEQRERADHETDHPNLLLPCRFELCGSAAGADRHGDAAYRHGHGADGAWRACARHGLDENASRHLAARNHAGIFGCRGAHPVELGVALDVPHVDLDHRAVVEEGLQIRGERGRITAQQRWRSGLGDVTRQRFGARIQFAVDLHAGFAAGDTRDDPGIRVHLVPEDGADRSNTRQGGQHRSEQEFLF